MPRGLLVKCKYVFKIYTNEFLPDVRTKRIKSQWGKEKKKKRPNQSRLLKAIIIIITHISLWHHDAEGESILGITRLLIFWLLPQLLHFQKPLSPLSTLSSFHYRLNTIQRMTCVCDSLSLFSPRISQFLCYLIMPKAWNSLSQLPRSHEAFKNFIALRLSSKLVRVYTDFFCLLIYSDCVT